MTNNLSDSVTYYSLGTPFSDLFTEYNGLKIVYEELGQEITQTYLWRPRLVHQGPPPFLLEPGESISVLIDIPLLYDITRPGLYSITVKSKPSLISNSSNSYLDVIETNLTSLTREVYHVKGLNQQWRSTDHSAVIGITKAATQEKKMFFRIEKDANICEPINTYTIETLNKNLRTLQDSQREFNGL